MKKFVTKSLLNTCLVLMIVILLFLIKGGVDNVQQDGETAIAAETSSTPACDDRVGLTDLQMEVNRKANYQADVKGIEQIKEVQYDAASGVRDCTAIMGFTANGVMTVGNLRYSYIPDQNEGFVTKVQGFDVVNTFAAGALQ